MKAATKVQKTLAQTIDQLGKDIARMEKKVAAMRRRIGAITRKHAKLQERIARLEAEGRIVKLSHYNDILTGINCWYVKAESLNTNPDSITNYYYEVTYSAERGYGCGCEDVRQCDCKHAKALGSYLHQEQEEKTVLQAIQEIADAHEQAKVAQVVAQAHEDYQRYVAPLKANRGFQMMR